MDRVMPPFTLPMHPNSCVFCFGGFFCFSGVLALHWKPELPQRFSHLQAIIWVQFLEVPIPWLRGAELIPGPPQDLHVDRDLCAYYQCTGGSVSPEVPWHVVLDPTSSIKALWVQMVVKLLLFGAGVGWLRTSHSSVLLILSFLQKSFLSQVFTKVYIFSIMFVERCIAFHILISLKSNIG